MTNTQQKNLLASGQTADCSKEPRIFWAFFVNLENIYTLETNKKLNFAFCWSEFIFVD